MVNVEYTHYSNRRSDAVSHAYYNQNTGELVLNLGGNLYQYKNVPLAMWESYNLVPSVGRDWLPNLKKQYGPSSYIGQYYWLNAKMVDVAKTEAVGTPKSLVDKTQPYLSLVSETPDNVNRPHTVHFDVNGNAKEYTLTDVSSVEDAVQALADISEALGVDIKVKGVFVNFE